MVDQQDAAVGVPLGKPLDKAADKSSRQTFVTS